MRFGARARGAAGGTRAWGRWAAAATLLAAGFGAAAGCSEEPGWNCPPGLIWCDPFCVDPATSGTNCGGCGTVCGEGRVCGAGACVCVPGRLACGETCVDPGTDEAHCGGCGVRCAAEEICLDGACAAGCLPPLTACGGDCVDLQSSEAHCGACGAACGASEACESGVCGEACAAPMVLCGDLCTDLSWDAAHCGSCHTACGPGETCWDGVCQSRWGSCPYVYLWDGQGWNYHTDLSGSPLGAGLPFFRPAYYGAGIYELGDFAAHDGRYRMRLRELVFEATFLDELALLVVDVPAGHGVWNAWSFTSQLERLPSREFHTVKGSRTPRSAMDDAGRDVREEVSRPDGRPLAVRPDGLSRVVLDFGPIERPEHARLVLTTWGTYQDLRDRQPPPHSAGTTVETPGPDGEWVVRVVGGKSASDARTWVLDLAGLLPADDTRMRLTLAHQPSVLDVLDAVLLDDSEPVPVAITEVRPRAARLRFGGSAVASAARLDRRLAVDDAHRPVIPDALLSGDYTRYGEVGPLLERADDRFVLLAHGDELVLEFEAPPERPGFERRAFLRADLFYTLKYHPFGRLTETLEPLPFHGMTRYPYPPEEWPYRGDASYAAYRAEWNTRRIQAPPSPER